MMKEFLWRPLILSSFIMTATAHEVGTVLPGAGSILQQVQPLPTPTFSPNSPLIMFDLPGGREIRLLSNETFLLRGISITNNTIFDTATLSALVADALGKTLSLSQLSELAARITDYYRSHGYPLARTIIPAQTIDAGVLRLEVIEPRYGKITLDNQSQVRTPLLKETLANLIGGGFLEESELDRTLLLLSDMPGMIVVPSLKLGTEFGTSDLIVKTTSGPGISGNIGLNNHGNKYTGGENLSGSVVVNNPFHHGDTLALNVLSAGPGMNYGNVAYDALLNGHGLHVGGSTSSLRYNFRTSSPTADPTVSSPLTVSGTAQLTSLWVKQALLRSRDQNVYGQLKYDYVVLQDHIDAPDAKIYNDRHLENITANLSGNFQSTLMTIGMTAWSLDTTLGKLVFDDPTAKTENAKTTNTSGSFSKFTASVFHIQKMGGQRELVVGFRGQWARANLDSSQKMVAGGPYSVRAYAAGTLSADAGYLLFAELKQPIRTALNGQLTATAFIDTTTMTINKKPWSEAGANHSTLSGAGLGLNWAGTNQYTGMAYVATPIGAKSPLMGSVKSTQFSIEFQKRF
jgi:hemolysin activation/secretion protein